MPTFARPTSALKRSRLHEMHRLLAQPGLISLANGAPAEDLFPLERIEGAFGLAIRHYGPAALQYSLTEGFPLLREWLAVKARTSLISCGPDDVLITNGIQQAIDLAGRVVIDPGDQILVDDPTYPGLLDALAIFEPEYLPVPMTAHGTDVDAMRRLLVHDRATRPFRIKMLYVIPNFQNPTGKTLGVAERRELAALAEEYDLPVIEDDAYGDLRYELDRLPSIKSFDASGNVLYLGSFSKILAPGMRLGWVVTGRQLLEPFIRAKQAADLHTSIISQVAAYEASRDGFFERHIAHLVAEYRRRRDAVVASIQTEFPGEAQFVPPQGGFFIWVDLPARIDAETLFEAAIRRQAVCLPGAWFCLGGGGHHAIRLGYSGASPAKLAEGVRRIGYAIADVLDGSAAAGA